MPVLSLRSLWSLVSSAAPLEDETLALARPANAAPRPVPAAEQAAADTLRADMLALAAQATGIEGVRLRRSIALAPDLQALWFLRSNLAAALSESQGEDAAMRRIEAISAPVRRRLPPSLATAAHAPRPMHH